MLESLLDRATGLRAPTLLKKRHRNTLVPWNFGTLNFPPWRTKVDSALSLLSNLFLPLAGYWKETYFGLHLWSLPTGIGDIQYQNPYDQAVICCHLHCYLQPKQRRECFCWCEQRLLLWLRCLNEWSFPLTISFLHSSIGSNSLEWSNSTSRSLKGLSISHCTNCWQESLIPTILKQFIIVINYTITIIWADKPFNEDERIFIASRIVILGSNGMV